MKITLRLEGPTQSGKTYHATKICQLLHDLNLKSLIKIKKKEYPLVPRDIEEYEINIQNL